MADREVDASSATTGSGRDGYHFVTPAASEESLPGRSRHQLPPMLMSAPFFSSGFDFEPDLHARITSGPVYPASGSSTMTSASEFMSSCVNFERMQANCGLPRPDGANRMYVSTM